VTPSSERGPAQLCGQDA